MFKNFKNRLAITICITLLSVISGRTVAALVYSELELIHIDQLSKATRVFECGKSVGRPDMLVVGPATIFRDGLLPEVFCNDYHIYFVDIFDRGFDLKQQEDHFEKSLVLDDFIEAIETIRNRLEIDKMVLFGHSANGMLAVEYSERYPEHVLYNVLIGTSPFRGTERQEEIDRFFAENADDDRKELSKKDEKELLERDIISFVDMYNSKRAFNFYKPEFDTKNREAAWGDLSLDEGLTKRYFYLLDDLDLRKYSEGLKTPTFLGLGEHDFTCPYTLWAEKSSELLESRTLRYVFFNESSHFAMLEEPDEFIEQLNQFLQVDLNEHSME